MLRILSLIFFLFYIPNIYGQDSKAPITMGAGYFGETFTKPGVSLSLQRPVFASDKHHLRLNVVFYKHSGYNKNLLLLPEYVFFKPFYKGFFYEVAAGGGWMYQKADATIIQFENGDFSEAERGWSYLAPTIVLGLGKKILNGSLENMAFSAGFRWFGQYPFNDFLMHHYAIECRISFPLSILQ